MLSYIEADEALRTSVVEQWKSWFPSISRYINPSPGFTIVALDGEEAVGLIAVKIQSLPAPLAGETEGFIDDIEVLESHRRQGVATRLIEESFARAAKREAVQLRAWSSDDKTEAIPMWKALGFGLCPAKETQPTGEVIPGYFVAKPVTGEP